MALKKKFNELSRPTQIGIITAGLVELLLKIAALRDISKRARQDLNGPKVLWFAACFINTLGPLSYFVFGRKKVSRS